MTTRSERLRAYFNFQGEPVNERHAKTRAVFEALVSASEALADECYCHGEDWDCEPCEALLRIDKILERDGT